MKWYLTIVRIFVVLVESSQIHMIWTTANCLFQILDALSLRLLSVVSAWLYLLPIITIWLVIPSTMLQCHGHILNILRPSSPSRRIISHLRTKCTSIWYPFCHYDRNRRESPCSYPWLDQASTCICHSLQCNSSSNCPSSIEPTEYLSIFYSIFLRV